MYTVATILHQNREQLGFSLQEVSKKTKVPVKYLQAFESELYKDYPPEPYCSLHIKTYAAFLGLNQDNILALFRRDYASYEKKRLIPRPLSVGLLTPQRVFRLGVLGLTLVFVTYLFFSYLQFNQPPRLSVNWPAESILTENSVIITGQASEDSAVRVNQDLVFSREGVFSKEIFLSKGDNTITVEALGRNGKITSETRTIQKQ